jgi:hypothetical protein
MSKSFWKDQLLSQILYSKIIFSSIVKNIGILYLIFALLIFLMGLIIVVLIRLELKFIVDYAELLCLVPVVFHSKTRLDPYYITGFTDAEGCFTIKITRNDKCKTGYQIQPVFQIGLHKKDRILLEKIQLYFKGVGSIGYSKDIDVFVVSSKRELKVIIDHFDKYPLITQK